MRTDLEYHERLYSGFAQQHFAKPAVRAFRAHLVRRILHVTGAGPRSRVLSLGCGIGDTEILLASSLSEIVGLDLSPAAIRQARADTAQAGLKNVQFLEGTVDRVSGTFDLVIAIFFLHYLAGEILNATPRRVHNLLVPGGRFYGLDPSRYRLSGAIGAIFIPHLMRKYQSPDERELDGKQVKNLFKDAGFECRTEFYDYISTPLAGLFPAWRPGYAAALGG